MPRLSLTGYLLLAVLVLGAYGGFATWRWLSAGARCEAKQAAAVTRADRQVRKDEGKRDAKLDRITVDTRASTRKAVSHVEEQTHARAQSIERVAVSGACRAPDGLPDLGPAVDQANAAAGD